MYEHYWGLKRSPFSYQGGEETFFQSRSHQASLLKLRYLIETSQGAGLLSSQCGLGKTCLLDVLAQQLQPEKVRFVNVIYPQLTAPELVGYLAGKLQASATEQPGRLDVMLRDVEARLRTLTSQGWRTVIVVDDAHLIEDRHVFQALQLLLNFRKPNEIDLTLILAGQLDLIGAVRRVQPLDERLAFKCLLQPLTEEETRQYVLHRLTAAGAEREIFAADAFRAIHQLSAGIPRRINRLCDFALLVGYSDELPEITAGQISAVAEELIVASAA